MAVWITEINTLHIEEEFITSLVNNIGYENPKDEICKYS